jgi:hypothetical protein
MTANITHVLHSLNGSFSHDDLLFCAMLVTGFHALMRSGELTVPDNTANRNSQKLTKRHTVRWPTTTLYGFTLPTIKTNPFFEGNHLVIQQLTPELDPRPHFISYLTSYDSSFPLHPELWLTAKGLSPTCSWFISCLHEHFPNLNITGQSMCASSTMCLASTGTAPSIIQAAGRWASNTFQIYIQKNPILLNAMLNSDPNDILFSFY